MTTTTTTESPKTIGDLFGALSPACWGACECCGVQFMSSHELAYQGRCSHSLRCERCGPRLSKLEG